MLWSRKIQVGMGCAVSCRCFGDDMFLLLLRDCVSKCILEKGGCHRDRSR